MKTRTMPRDEIYSLAAECEQLHMQKASDDVEYILRRYRRTVLLVAAGDACMYCGGRCPQYAKLPTGPNPAGNYVHTGKDGQQSLCVASSIHARIRWEQDNGVGMSNAIVEEAD